MKNYQKNARNPFMPVPCMKNQLIHAVSENIIWAFLNASFCIAFESLIQMGFNQLGSILH